MNKLFTKVAALSVGLAMAIGVGVGLGARSVRSVKAADTWDRTDPSSLSTGDIVAIVDLTTSKAMSNNNGTSTAPSATAVSISNDKSSLTAAPASTLQWVVTISNGSYSFNVANTSNYLYATATNNGVRVGTNSNNAFTIFDNDGVNFLLNTATTRYIGVYNSQDWRCYTSINNNIKDTVLAFYKKNAQQGGATLSVSPDSANLTVGGYTTLSATTTGGSGDVTWVSDEPTIASVSTATGNSVTLTANARGSTTITASYSTANDVEIPVLVTNVQHAGTDDDPYTVEDARDQIDLETGTTGVYATGIVSKIVTAYSSQYGNISFDISSDGTTSGEQLRGYRTVGTTEYPIDSEESVQVGDTVILYGNLTKYGVTYEFAEGNQLVFLSRPTLSSISVGGSMSNTSYTTSSSSWDPTGLTVTGTFSDSSSRDLTSEATFTYYNSSDEEVATPADLGVGNNQTLKVIAHVDEISSTKYTASTSISVVGVIEYQLVTDPSTLADGTTFVLVNYVSSTYRIAHDLNNGHIKMNTVTSATTVSGTTAGSTVISTEADVFTLVGSSGQWEIMRGDEYLQFTGTSNGNDSFTSTSSADTKFSIVAGSDNKLTIKSNSRSSRALRYNTSTGDLRNYADNGSQRDLYMFAVIPAQNELDSVTVTFSSDPADRTFTAGSTFAFNGTLTAHYTLAADATVIPTGYFLEGEEGVGEEITTSTILNVADFNGGEVYVQYKEGGITKYDTFNLIVNYAPVTSVVIDTHSAQIGLNEAYNVSSIGVTVNSQYAQQGYEWIVSANTVDDDYLFEDDELLSGNTAGTITLRCRSTADNSKYDELVVTVTAAPTASFAKASESGYVGKSVDVDFTYGNMADESLIAVTSSNTSYVEVDEVVALDGEGVATLNLVGAGTATLSISYDGGSALATMTVTANEDSVVSVNWSATNIKVYSGATITSDIDNTWEVNYETASGDADYITYGEYTLKLGGSAMTLPHTWTAEDDGKTLCVEYGGVSSSTVNVDVTQTIRPVMASTTSSWEYTFGAKVWSAAGDQTLDGHSWTMSGTDDGTPYFGYDATKGQQFGSGTHPFSDISLQSSDFAGTIESVTVYTSGANSINATVQVSVGGTAYGAAINITSTSTAYTFDLGGKSGTISIDYVNSSSKAIYIKEIVVNTVSGSTNIANVTGHEAAQKAVVKFAKAFNAAMDTTANCTTNMESAWSTASAAWTTFNTDISSLSAEEQAYAKNLIKYASAQWTPSTDTNYEYCLERAMATYDACVSIHGMTAFMSTVRPVSTSAVLNPLAIVNASNNTTLIIVIVSILSVAAVGGYFFFKKRKEQ